MSLALGMMDARWLMVSWIARMIFTRTGRQLQRNARAVRNAPKVPLFDAKRSAQVNQIRDRLGGVEGGKIDPRFPQPAPARSQDFAGRLRLIIEVQLIEFLWTTNGRVSRTDAARVKNDKLTPL